MSDETEKLENIVVELTKLAKSKGATVEEMAAAYDRAGVQVYDVCPIDLLGLAVKVGAMFRHEPAMLERMSPPQEKL